MKWPSKTFGELAEFKNGLNFSPNAKGSRIKLVGVSDFQSHFRIGYENLQHVEVVGEVQKGFLLREKDLLFVRSNGNKALIGRCLLIERLTEPVTHSGFTIRARITDEDVEPECVGYFFQSSSARRAIAMAGGGTNISNLSQDVLAQIPIPLPKRAEQQRIAAILGAWDRAIEKLQALVQAKTERLSALRQQLLTGTRRFPKFNAHSWGTKRVGDLLKSVNRYEKWDDRRTFKLAGVRRNSGGVFFRDELPGAGIKVKVCKKIHSGDFLISRRQVTWGGMSIVPPEFHGYDVNDEYEVLAVRDPAAFDMRFFHYLSQTARLKNLAYLASNGVFAERLRLNFDLDAFLHQPIRVPSLKEEQLRIVAVLDSCVREIRLLEAELGAVKQQKRGLMQKLLTGEIRVKSPAR